MLRRTTASLLLVAAVMAALVSCTAAPPPRRSPTPSAPEPVAASGDTTLRIGTLFPMTGDAAAIGAAQVAGAALAAREISEQGLVLGHPVELLPRNSAGEAGTVTAAVADLVARGVDVVLWDATGAVPADVAETLAAADIAVIALAQFANGGTPLAADDAFAARLRTMDPGLPDTAGGGEAYDGVMLAALAATASGDDGGRSVSSALERVGSGPVVCASWGECAAALAETQQIAYQGVTGRRS